MAGTAAAANSIASVDYKQLSFGAVNIGDEVIVMHGDEEVKGIVQYFNISFKILILKNFVGGGSNKSSTHMFNTDAVKFKWAGHCSDKEMKLLNDIRHIDLDKVTLRHQERRESRKMLFSDNSKVTVVEWNLYLYLKRFLDVTWHTDKTTLICNNEVCIKEPYGVDDCSLLAKVKNHQALSNVKTYVEKFHSCN